MLDVKDVAALLDVSEATVRTYLWRSTLPAPDGRVGRSPWWYRSTIDAWLAERARRKGGGE